jgi:HsdM N-terminal domain
MADSVTLNSPSALDGLEGKLWAAADALRNNMDAAEYKHVVLGLSISAAAIPLFDCPQLRRGAG